MILNQVERVNTTSLTANELYQAAAKGERSWEHVLLLTGLLYIDETGLVISPPPAEKHEFRFYKSRLNELNKYPNGYHQCKK